MKNIFILIINPRKKNENSFIIGYRQNNNKRRDLGFRVTTTRWEREVVAMVATAVVVVTDQTRANPSKTLQLASTP